MMRQTFALFFVMVLCLPIFLSLEVLAGDYRNPNEPQPVLWQSEHARLVFTGDGLPVVKEVDGKKCVESVNDPTNRYIYINIDDDYVFDWKTGAHIEVEYDSSVTGSLQIEYDSNFTNEQHKGAFHTHGPPMKPDKSKRWAKHTFRLPNARFSNRQHNLGDFRIYSPDGIARISEIKVLLPHQYVKKTTDIGKLKLRVIDEATGKPAPARVGIYNELDQFQKPAAHSNAVPINVFYRTTNMYNCRKDTSWPIANTYVFWVDGEYECELAPGWYRLIVRKGLEYYVAEHWFHIEAGQTTDHVVTLKRWINMPEKGWYSGDCHCHIGRTREQNEAILAQCAGEDLNVTNLSQMGNIETYYFRQYAFGKKGRFGRGNYFLVPGLEDPRTPHNGHTLALNVQEMVRDDETYYLYHRAFERIRRVGGLAGYAHMGRGFSAERGMALDMPFGLVDFVEVLQVDHIIPDVWYDFLNLGYKLTPSAGSDYPYADPPGRVRNYVYLGGPLDNQKWFEEFARGHTFVSSGPILTFTVNGKQMGSELQVETGTELSVEASAAINPTIDKLEGLELIVFGESIVKMHPTSSDQKSLKISHRLKADRSMWLAVKATCKGDALAHTAPIYVVVNGQRTWNRSAVKGIIKKQRQRLKALIETPVKPVVENWLTDTLKEKWQQQKGLMVQRVKAANAKYDELLEMLKKE